MDKEHRVSVYDMVKELNLKEVTPEINSKEVYIEQAEINRPALQLAGFFENFAQNRVQIIGKAEHLFIEEVEKDVENAKNIYKRFIGAGIPVIVFCRNLHPSEMMIRVAKEYGVPVLISQDATSEFMAEVIRWLGTVLAPSITIHGVLVDVFGEGILITGESGIGKSEAALELIRRGHRLVSDDVVEIKRVSKKSLIGTSPEVTRFFIELRGIGIIDVKNLYGVESVKMEQEINLVIQLEDWNKDADYDRLGLEEKYVEYLGNKDLYGIDIGGTTVKMGLFGEDGTLKEKWEIKTRTEENGKNILPDIAQAVNDHSKANGFDKEDVIGLGVGVPGAVLEFSKVNECVNLGWGSVDVAGELSKLTGCKVKATNDANAAALGEIWMGAAADYNSAVMITLGTGVGGGIIVDGKIIDGSRGYGGEIGHMTVDPFDDRVCNCGKTGCLELYASATGIVYETKKALKDYKEATILRDLDEVTAKDIFDAAKEGDTFAKERVDDLGQKLALAAGNIALMVDPEVFVIGGGVSRAGQILLDAVNAHFKKYTFGKAQETGFVLATLGNDAGIYGAASLMLS